MQSQTSTRSPFAVCVLPAPAKNLARTVQYPGYIREILDASGLCYQFAELSDLQKKLPELRVLLTVGESALPDESKDALRDWIHAGGIWITIAGACGLADVLGVTVEGAGYASWGGGQGILGEGYLKPETSHQATGHVRIPLHFFNGLPVIAGKGTVLAAALDAHGRPTKRAALVTNEAGKGRTYLIAPDIPGSVVRIQQGQGAVTRDGVPAHDGTAPIADDVLKSGDGHVMDWLLDRTPVPGVEGLSAFLEPIADQWRELLLRTIFAALQETKACVPLLWLYPRNLPAIAHISLDTDHNVPEQGRIMLDLLNAHKVRATWCTILPGYAREFIEEIFATGHELAMHYDSMTDGLHWERAQFARQWRELTALFDDRHIVSNKNHYLRWEGDTELWDWCIEHGIEIDQTKGASKTGEAGFNFGTCRPYFPVDFAGRSLNVLELPTPTQDLEVFAPRALAAPLLDAALRAHGIMHLLFHPAHVDKPPVAAAIPYAIQLARDAGLEWWTAAEINGWERARRAVRWNDCDGIPGSTIRFAATAAQDMPEATLLWLNAPSSQVSVGGKRVDTFRVTRWGTEFTGVTANLPADSQLNFILE